MGVAPEYPARGAHDVGHCHWHSGGQEIHRLIRGSDLRIFEESAHSIGGDEPQKCLDAICGFLVYNRGRTKS